MNCKSIDRRETILSAALSMLLEQEGRNLTLDAVAQKAGISKGGLMHHFHNKETLIEAAYAKMIDHVNDQIMRLSGGRELGTPQEMEAYITTSLDQPFRGLAAELGVGVVSLLGEDMTKNGKLLDPLRRLYVDRLRPFKTGAHQDKFSRVAIIFLAIEAFLFFDIFKLCEFTDEEVVGIKSALTDMVHDLKINQ